MEITNTMIYELLLEMKKRQDQMDLKFDQMASRQDQMDSRLALLETKVEWLCETIRDFKAETSRRLDRIELQQNEDHKVLMQLCEDRGKVKLELTRTLLTVTGLMSGIIAFVVSFVTGKAMIFQIK